MATTVSGEITSAGQLADGKIPQQTIGGATGASPGWYAQLTADAFARVRAGLNANDVASIAFGSGASGRDLFLERLGPASLRLGTADAAAPVAQTVSAQGVVAGTSNAAGANFTFMGSAGTGTGAGGSIIFQTAPAGTAGSTQNAQVTALTIAGSGAITTSSTFAAGGIITAGSGTSAVGSLQLTNSGALSWNARGAITSQAVGSLQVGPSDAASPGAQTFSAQSVVTGTTNTAGQNFTIRGSRGTGTGVGGSIVLQTAPAGLTGTAQNAAVTGLTVTPTGTAVASGMTFQLGNAATTGLTAGVLAALTNATIVIYDSTGQAYRIPCII